MERMIDDDCLPQKGLVLTEALKRKDAPQPPDIILNYDIDKFDQSFKSYWENIHQMARQIKKKHL